MGERVALRADVREHARVAEVDRRPRVRAAQALVQPVRRRRERGPVQAGGAVGGGLPVDQRGDRGQGEVAGVGAGDGVAAQHAERGLVAGAPRDQAADAGMAWTGIADADQGQPPYELRPDAGRRGPGELWQRFDRAVERLNGASAGTSLSRLATAYAELAAAAHALADRVDVDDPPAPWPSDVAPPGSQSAADRDGVSETPAARHRPPERPARGPERAAGRAPGGPRRRPARARACPWPGSAVAARHQPGSPRAAAPPGPSAHRHPTPAIPAVAPPRAPRRAPPPAPRGAPAPRSRGRPIGHDWPAGQPATSTSPTDRLPRRLVTLPRCRSTLRRHARVDQRPELLRAQHGPGPLFGTGWGRRPATSRRA